MVLVLYLRALPPNTQAAGSKKERHWFWCELLKP